MVYLLGITLLTGTASDGLIGGLVRQGYGVELERRYEGRQLLVLRISTDTRGVKGEKTTLQEHLKSVLMNSGTKYLSYVILPGTAKGIWEDGNLDLSSGRTVFEHLADD